MILGMTATRNELTGKQALWLRDQIDLATCLHHGACVGGDQAGHLLAVDRDLIIFVHPPLNERLMIPKHLLVGRATTYILPAKDYHPRNHDIIDDSWRLIALPDGPERVHSGTWSTVRYAIKRHKPVLICHPDGRIEPR